MMSANVFSEKSFDRSSGIYAIYNTENGKVYIGSSKNVAYRLRKHLETLIKNSHRNNHLQNSFNLHGISKFKLTFVEKCERSELLEREQFWIDLLCAANQKFGYNIIPRADRQAFSEEHRKNLSVSHFGLKHTIETRAKISKSSMGRVILSKRKPVLQVDDNGKIVERFPSISLASGNDRSKAVSINAACKCKVSITAYGYYWFYEEEFSEKELSTRQTRKLDERKKASSKLHKAVEQIELSGKICSTFNSIKEASISTGIRANSISSCTTKKLKTAGGFIWRKV